MDDLKGCGILDGSAASAPPSMNTYSSGRNSTSSKVDGSGVGMAKSGSSGGINGSATASGVSSMPSREQNEDYFTRMGAANAT